MAAIITFGTNVECKSKVSLSFSKPKNLEFTLFFSVRWFPRTGLLIRREASKVLH